jgi:starch synthase (maltosyl-transferring)
MRDDGRKRVIIENVTPRVDGGRFAVKRVLGDRVTVEADIFADGNDVLACRLLFRPEADPAWSEAPMAPLPPLEATAETGERRRGTFTVTELGSWRYSVLAWVDHWQTWRRDLGRLLDAGGDPSLHLRSGAALVEQAGERAREHGRQADARVLAGLARDLDRGLDRDERLRLALDAELSELMARHADRRFATRSEPELPLVVDRERARFGAWYELFPRSTVGPASDRSSDRPSDPPRHGTFRDLEERLRYAAELGFDVVELTPIHPIGTTGRRDPNNAPDATPDDLESPGSPWAAGSPAGGHTTIHPALGDRDGFRRLVARARDLGVEIALDLAFRCSPDHPLVAAHPEWFHVRPDGSLEPAGPDRDVHGFDFESDGWQALWKGIHGVVEHWIGEGVRAFRVDRPQDLPFAFWEWMLAEIRRAHPEVIVLAGAVPRPKILERLAKLGFTQSLTPFPWRRSKRELEELLTGLTRAPLGECLRPSLWPNTRDVLTDQLQSGERAMFVQRFLLAATLGATYGIYGPAFELMEHTARAPGSEEYRDSEKYQLRRWDLARPDSLRELIAHVNGIRRANRALQADHGLTFHPLDNEQILCFSKATEDRGNVVLVAVTLDTRNVQSGWTDLDLAALGLRPGAPFQVHDLLTGARYRWQGERNYVQLDPEGTPAHIFRVQRGEGG